MEKTNFTFVPALKWMLGALVLLMGFGASAQTLVCNNNVQVSVDPAPGVCQVEITADMILEGSANGVYDIIVYDNVTQIYNGPSPAVISNVQPYFGQIMNVTILEPASGNSCWGTIVIEDKTAPILTCTNLVANCNQSLPSGGTSATDNCTSGNQIDIQLTGEVEVDGDICDDNQRVVLRTYVAYDNEGNESLPCQQTITINRVEPDFPEDKEYSCNSVPNIFGNFPASGRPLSNPEDCNYAVSYADNILPTCGFPASTDSPVYKVVRTWTVLDWCTNAVITSNSSGDNVQVIKIADNTPPVITMAPVVVSANVNASHPNACASTAFIPAPSVSDNCTGVVSWSAFTTAGELSYIPGGSGGYIPGQGLVVGNHILTVYAKDGCDNIAQVDVPLTVVDNIAPVAICDEITDVNLSSDGQAVVPAATFDDGSYDNCCLDHFEVRRLDNPDCPGDDSTPFAASVPFSCCDMGSQVTVEFKAVDCYDNANTCMVLVNVQDKLSPIVQCPPSQTINCDSYWDDYETGLLACENDPDAEECQDAVLTPDFGAPVIYDNCQAIVTVNVNIDLDQCGVGTIVRSWSATDPSNNAPASCSQTIFVTHVSDWAVMFPDDKFVDCGVTVPDFGEPVLYFESCELLAVSFEDEIFTNVPNACYEIARQWYVINWCTVGTEIDDEVIELSESDYPMPVDFNGNGRQEGINNPLSNPAYIVGHSHRTFRENRGVLDAIDPNAIDELADPTQDGYITYQQVIIVNDQVAPVFDDCEIEDMCIFDGCDRSVILPTPTVSDCSTDITIEVESTTMPAGSGSGFGPYENIPPGTYTVVYKASDSCGNWEVCEASFTVEDCKNPTPYCEEGLIVGIMNTNPPMVDVWASDFDAGSFDNCGVKAISFSENINDTQRVFTCDDLGEQPIELWVTDDSDNKDFCLTFVVVQDQMGVCTNNLVVSGTVETENQAPVQDVSVEMSGQSNGTVMTGSDGTYSFNVPNGNDITITPSKDDDANNGVTTFDIVLISKHILGTELLDSPYKMIAADANNSESITTFDVVTIRKLILQITTNFPDNTSWRFVDEGYAFPNPTNPWSETFPEIVNFNNIAISALNTDFVAVKIGDVNGSAQTQSLLGTDDRNTAGTFQLNATDRLVKAGETVTVDFTASQDVQGYQFTLNHTDAIDFVEMTEGVAKEENFGFALLNEKAITTSWNGTGIDNGTAFSMTFTANSDVMLSEALSANSRYTVAEAYSSTGEILDVELNFNRPSSTFELYQNTPNPFNGETFIGFNLPEAGTATLTVSDVSGKVLTVIEREFAKGYNQVSFSNLPATGVMYYTLATANETATKKMVATK